MSEWLTTLWTTLNETNVYSKWPGGYLGGLLFESGVLNDEPLLELVTKILDSVETLGRHLIVAADDSQTGNYIAYDMDKVAKKDIPRRVVASASIPLVFPN